MPGLPERGERVTDFLASLFDDPEDDPIEVENVRDGLGYHHDDHNAYGEGEHAGPNHFWRND